MQTAKSLEFDHIVIGSGSSGSVVARRLVDAGRRVALIESGGSDEVEAVLTASRHRELLSSDIDYGFVTEPQAGACGRRISWPRGNVLGGTSSLNGMVYARGHRGDYDNWAYNGADGWSYDEVLPYFIRSEDYAGGRSVFHGTGGPLPVRVNTDPHELAQALLDGAVQAGFDRNDDQNGADTRGVGLCEHTIRDHQRVSSWRAFGKPIEGNPLLQVFTRTWVTKVELDGDRAVGVRAWREGAEVLIRSSGDIVLAAGAIGTPQLLQLSGIGPAKELDRLGVPVVVDLVGVGENLHDHLLLPVTWTSKKAVVWGRHPGLQVHLFTDSRHGAAVPDLQPVSMLSAFPVAGYDIPFDRSYTWLAGLVRPYSRGRLWLESSDPSVKPRLDPRILSDPADLAAMVSGIKICRSMGEQEALSDWNGGELVPGPDVQTDDEIAAYARQAVFSYYHPVGTAKMGIDAMSVVDPQLRVHGLSNLRVADASVFPDVPSGNTHAPAVMVGERAADFILRG